jgi:drug/metabolite transporter (DMT)-like permease
MFNYFYFSVTLITLYITKVNIFSDKFITTSKFGLLILRNLLAICSIILLTFALKYMHISDVFSIFFIYPAFVIIFSILFLGEKSWWFDYVCCITCFIGVVLIVRPDFIFDSDRQKESKNFYFLLVILSALIKACEDVSTRFLGKEIHFQSINLFYSSMGMLIFPSILIILHSQMPSFTVFEYLIFFFTGLSAWLYQTFATLAFQNENAGRVSIINYLQVDFMYIIDITVFHKQLILTDLIGTLLIFSFNFANGVYKTMRRIAILNKEIDRQNTNTKFKAKRNISLG